MLTSVRFPPPIWLQVVHRPSIGKPDVPLEPKPRESLLAPGSTSRRPSVESLASTKTGASASTLAAEKKEREEKEMVQRANEAVMERQRFAIDEVGDDDDEIDGEVEDTTADDGVMDEVSPGFS